MDGEQHAVGTSPAPDAMAHAKEAAHGLEGWLAPIFAKFPHLPAGGRKFIVDVAPYIALIFGILGVIALISAGGLGMLMMVATLGMGLPMMVQVVFGLVSAVLLLMAFTGLKARTKKGWNFVFYSQIVSVIGGVLSVVLGNMYGITGMIIGALIGFYLLFEVRESYR